MPLLLCSHCSRPGWALLAQVGNCFLSVLVASPHEKCVHVALLSKAQVFPGACPCPSSQSERLWVDLAYFLLLGHSCCSPLKWRRMFSGCCAAPQVS